MALNFPNAPVVGQLYVGDHAVYSWDGVKWVATSIGDSGDGQAGYYHTQLSPSDSWTIHHNLDRYPAVVVLDSSNRQVFGDVQYLSTNTLVVTFNAPFSGNAQLV
jgi:hypothetical protein